MSATEYMEAVGAALVLAGLVCLSRPRWRAMEQAQWCWRIAVAGFVMAVTGRLIGAAL